MSASDEGQEYFHRTVLRELTCLFLLMPRGHHLEDCRIRRRASLWSSRTISQLVLESPAALACSCSRRSDSKAAADDVVMSRKSHHEERKLELPTSQVLPL